MALIGLELSSTQDYTFSGDPAKGTDDATVFVLGTLTARQRAYIKDQATALEDGDDGDPTLKFKANFSALAAFRLGVKDIKNFVDEKGKEIKFTSLKTNVGGTKGTLVSESIVDRLPFEVIQEVSEKIMNENEVTEEEAKNSEG